MIQRAQRLRPGHGKMKRAQVPKLPETRLDQVENLFGHGVGTRTASGRAQHIVRGRFAVVVVEIPLAARRLVTLHQVAPSCGASRGRNTPSAIPCGPRPRRRTRPARTKRSSGQQRHGQRRASSASIRRHSPGCVARPPSVPCACGAAQQFAGDGALWRPDRPAGYRPPASHPRAARAAKWRMADRTSAIFLGWCGT